jgi:8-oxo-dGTP pyrophosphatase MutT (NUDIX family)
VPEPASTRTVYEGAFVRVDVEEWPDLGPWEVIVQRGAAAVLPLTPDGDVLLVRQLRPAVRDRLTEIPAGLLDVDGEDALSCATRELFEETGYRHRSIEFLGGTYVSPGSTNHYVHLFWARTEPEPAGAPETGIELLREPLGAMLEAARAGRVRDAKTALALLMLGAREVNGGDRS